MNAISAAFNTAANFAAPLTNLSVASPTIGGTCTGVTNTPALVAGATAINLTVPSLPVGSCTITLSLTSTTVGTQSLATSGVTTTEIPVAGAASNTASLTVRATAFPATIATTFTPAWIGTGATSTLTFALASPSAVALTNATFTDALTNMTVAAPTIGGTCTGVTNSPALTAGAGALNLTIPTLPAAGCTVTVQVTSAVLGSNATAASGVTSVETVGAGAASNTAYLTVSPVDVGFSYVHADHLGSPRAITRPSDNAVVWRWDAADPFGANLPDQNPSGLGIFTCNLRFPGQYYDQETGTFYNGMRDYVPGLGGYQQSDPIGLRGGINTYAYVGGNPLSNVDPTGEATIALPGVGGAGASGAGSSAAGAAASRLLGGLGLLLSLGGDTQCKAKCFAVTEQNIRSVLASSPMMTYQPTVSMGVILGYVVTIENGVALPPIQVDGIKLVDGNHRYIAGLLCKQPTASIPWTAPLTRKPVPIQSLRIAP